MQSSMATSIAPNPFRETWSKYLSSSCTAHSPLLPCHCQNGAWRSNWVRAVRRRQKLPVANVVLSLCGGVKHSDPTMQSTCFDSSTRATLMPLAVSSLWPNQQQFLRVCRRCWGHLHRAASCVFIQGACNCKSNTTELTTLFDKSR